MIGRAVGVIGTGAMGLGVVKSLVRGGFDVLVRDIDPDAEAAAVASGAEARPSASAVARECSTVIVLVVDARQIDTVLDGPDGAAASFAPGSILFIASTVAPAYVAERARSLAAREVTVIDAPVSGGPRRAADGSMTMMLAGRADVIAASHRMLEAIAGNAFVVGDQPGAAATFKVLNNQLAAINLAAGAEAMALAIRAGLDPLRFLEVVNASSGASWIFLDRMRRALAGDTAVHAATTLLAKDVSIAVDTATALGCQPTFSRLAREAFMAAIERGYGGEDDAAMLRFYRDADAPPAR